MGLEGIVSKRLGSLRALARLAQGEESGRAGGEALGLLRRPGATGRADGAGILGARVTFACEWEVQLPTAFPLAPPVCRFIKPP